MNYRLTQELSFIKSLLGKMRIIWLLNIDTDELWYTMLKSNKKKSQKKNIFNEAQKLNTQYAYQHIYTCYHQAETGK